MGLNKLKNVILDVESGPSGPCFVAVDMREGKTAFFDNGKPQLQGR